MRKQNCLRSSIVACDTPLLFVEWRQLWRSRISARTYFQRCG